jgi:hypothetical protein
MCPWRVGHVEQSEADNQERHRQSGTEGRPQKQLRDAPLTAARRLAVLGMSAGRVAEGEGEHKRQAGNSSTAPARYCWRTGAKGRSKHAHAWAAR